MPERRLEIAIKGGVSLGAYEAGVIAETLYLLDYNNRNNSVKWYVEALTGASAGRMTATLLATVLLNNALGGAVPDANVLKTVWVDQISLDVLDPQNANGLSPNYLFASGAIDQIASTTLNFPTASRPIPLYAIR